MCPGQSNPNNPMEDSKVMVCREMRPMKGLVLVSHQSVKYNSNSQSDRLGSSSAAVFLKHSHKDMGERTKAYFNSILLDYR